MKETDRMCDEKQNPMVATQQASAARVVDLLGTAERELAAFYAAVVGRYGPEEARRAAYGWIEEMETMDWPADWALPNWRHVTIAAADCLALGIIDHSPGR
jgi:hypothetical protein